MRFFTSECTISTRWICNTGASTKRCTWPTGCGRSRIIEITAECCTTVARRGIVIGGSSTAYGACIGRLVDGAGHHSCIRREHYPKDEQEERRTDDFFHRILVGNKSILSCVFVQLIDEKEYARLLIPSGISFYKHRIWSITRISDTSEVRGV